MDPILRDILLEGKRTSLQDDISDLIEAYEKETGKEVAEVQMLRGAEEAQLGIDLPMGLVEVVIR
jgi:hypothetical protein